MFAPPIRWGVATLVAAVLLPSVAKAEVIDLTTAGSSGSSQGALFYQASQSTGTGSLDPFLRIQRSGTERGYNTEGQIQFDTKDQGGHNWTHALPLNTMTPVTLNGIQYYQFLLDVNESGNDKNRLLSINDFRLYLGDARDLTDWNDGFGTHSVKVYDLDAGPKGDTTIELDYKLNSGSGSGDMYAYVPVSLFQRNDSQFPFVYLYSAFGDPNGSNAGFEEWASLNKNQTTPNGVPAPPGVVLAGMGIGGLLLGRLRFRRK